jgi:hypothetical protein
MRPSHSLVIPVAALRDAVLATLDELTDALGGGLIDGVSRLGGIGDRSGHGGYVRDSERILSGFSMAGLRGEDHFGNAGPLPRSPWEP